MVQILNRPKTPGLGSLLGQGIATGLSDRFRMLEEQKRLKQQRGDTQAALEALGYEPSIAQRLSALDTQTLRQVLSQQHEQQQLQSRFGMQQQQAQQQAQQSDADLQQAMQSAGIPDDLAQEVLPLLKQYPADKRGEFIQELSNKVKQGEEIPEEQKEQFKQILELTQDEAPEQLASMDFSNIAQAAQAGPLTVDKFNEMFISNLKSRKAPQAPQAQAQPAQEQTPLIPQAAQEQPPQAPERSMLEEVSGRKEQVQKKPTIAEILRRPSSKELAAEKNEKLKQDLLSKKETAKEDERAAKEGQKVIEEIEKENKGAEEIDRTLKRMSKIIDEGGLPTAALYSGLNSLKETLTPVKAAATLGTAGGAIGTLLGGGAGALTSGGLASIPAAIAAGKTGAVLGTAAGTGLGLIVNPIIGLVQYGQKGVNPNQQEFEKLSQGFLKFAKNYFPRLTERELVEYMKTVPTLSQTDAGKKAIIKNMGLMNRIAKIKNTVLQDILEENDGKIPKNLRALVDKRAAPRIKGIEKLLEEGLDDAVNLF